MTMTMICLWNDWRVRRLQRKLAGLKAKYISVQKMVDLCQEIPNFLAFDMCNLPQKIAEIEELLNQLKVN